MESIVCWVCRRRIPAAFAHDHHTRPQAAGGQDIDIEKMCSGCHDNTHRVASMLSGPRASQAQDTVAAYYGADGDAAHRCMELALKVVRHMAEKATGVYKVAAHESVELMIEIPLAVKNALMVLGREARDPQGKRLGLAGAARAILIEAVVRRFPAIKEEVQRSAEQKNRQNPDAHYARPRRAVKGPMEAFDVETAKR